MEVWMLTRSTSHSNHSQPGCRSLSCSRRSRLQSCSDFSEMKVTTMRKLVSRLRIAKFLSEVTILGMVRKEQNVPLFEGIKTCSYFILQKVLCHLMLCYYCLGYALSQPTRIWDDSVDVTFNAQFPLGPGSPQRSSSSHQS